MEDEKHKLFSERGLFDSGSHDALEQLVDGLVNLLVSTIKNGTIAVGFPASLESIEITAEAELHSLCGILDDDGFRADLTKLVQFSLAYDPAQR
jgi:hypothetical protein